MNKLKKNWKEILILLLILFGLNKVMTDSIKSLNVTIANLADKNGMLSEFNRQQTKSDSLNRAAQKEQLNQVKNMVNRLKRK